MCFQFGAEPFDYVILEDCGRYGVVVRVCFCLNVVCDGVSRGMLFYCARKMARAAAIPISRLRIAPLVPLIGGENFRSYKKICCCISLILC